MDPQSTQGVSPPAPLTDGLKGYTIPKKKHSGPKGSVQTYGPRQVQTGAGQGVPGATASLASADGSSSAQLLGDQA